MSKQYRGFVLPFFADCDTTGPLGIKLIFRGVTAVHYLDSAWQNYTAN